MTTADEREAAYEAALPLVRELQARLVDRRLRRSYRDQAVAEAARLRPEGAALRSGAGTAEETTREDPPTVKE